MPKKRNWRGSLTAMSGHGVQEQWNYTNEFSINCTLVSWPKPERLKSDLYLDRTIAMLRCNFYDQIFCQPEPKDLILAVPYQPYLCLLMYFAKLASPPRVSSP